MHRRILIVPAGQRRPVTSVCLGLVHALRAAGADAGYAKPIAQQLADGVEDQSGEVFRMVTSLRPPPPVSVARCAELLAVGAMDMLMAEVAGALGDELASREIVLLEGLAPIRETIITAQLNRELAASLDADAVLVASAADSGLDAVVEQVAVAARSWRGRLIGVVAEGVPAGSEARVALIRARLAEMGLNLVAAVPDSGELSRIRVADLARALDLEVVHRGDQDRRIVDTIVAAQAMPGFVEFLSPGRLVIVPGDRHDVFMAAALAELRGRPLAAVLLTAGIRPSPRVVDLCHSAIESGLPVLATDALTYETAADVHALDVQLPADDAPRIEGIMRAYGSAFDPEWIAGLRTRERPHRFTSAELRANVVRQLGFGRYTVALAGPFTPAWLQAATTLRSSGTIRCLLVGDPDQIASVASQSGGRVPAAARVVDPAALRPELVHEFMRVRSCGYDEAARALTDPLTHALAMLAAGQVDAVIGGETAPGSDLLRLSEEIIGIRPDLPFITSANVLLGHDEVLVFADCALNEEPGPEALAAIAALAADGAAAAGVEPRIAFISQGSGRSCGGTGTEAEGGCGHGPDAGAGDRLRQAIRVLADKRPDLQADGPLELEAAISPDRAQALHLGGGIAGRASVCVFADRQTAQAQYIAMQRRTGASRLGPLVHGFLKSVNSVPAGATADEIVDLIALTALQGGHV